MADVTVRSSYDLMGVHGGGGGGPCRDAASFLL